MYRRKASVTVTALTAGSEETYTITEPAFGSPRSHVLPAIGAQKADVVVVNPGPTNEVGWGITKAWVDAEGVIKFSASNFGGTTLDGSTQVVYYAVLR